MADISLQQILGSPVVTGVVSQIKVPGTALQTFFFGGGLGGTRVGGRHFGYDIFDNSRSIARFRPHGSAPGVQAAQPVGHVSGTFLRTHEKIPLLDNFLIRTRALGQGWGTTSDRNVPYITAQERKLAQTVRNAREYTVASMMNGGTMGVLVSGQDFIPVAPASGTFTVSWQIPAGNGGDGLGTSKLDMLGGGDILAATWATASTDIPGDLFQINSAFEELHGMPLRHVWCNSVVFGNVLNNTKVQALAGSVNRPWRDWRTGSAGDTVPSTAFEVVLEGLPWLTWHVYDAGINVNGTFTKYFDNTHAVFCADPDPGWIEMYEGSEYVRENVAAGPDERYGFSAWTEPRTQPAGFELIAVDNFFPALKVPKAIAHGLVIY